LPPQEASTRNPPGLAVNRIQPAYVQVAEQIRVLILSGELNPGDQLPGEGKLSTLFGVSRSTVRESLRVLSAQGLIHSSRGVTGGTFVSATTPELITNSLVNGLTLLSGAKTLSTQELLEARELFEVPATRLAAKNATAEQLADIRQTLEREAAAPDRGARFDRNSAFHTMVLEAGGNQLVAVMVAPIFNVIRSQFLNELDREFWTKVDQEHFDILAHLEAGDEDKAGQAMHQHLVQLRQAYEPRDDG
jgi:DNA-binding FadR family transcriptional regulator